MYFDLFMSLYMTTFCESTPTIITIKFFASFENPYTSKCPISLFLNIHKVLWFHQVCATGCCIMNVDVYVNNILSHDPFSEVFSLIRITIRSWPHILKFPALSKTTVYSNPISYMTICIWWLYITFYHLHNITSTPPCDVTVAVGEKCLTFSSLEYSITYHICCCGTIILISWLLSIYIQQTFNHFLFLHSYCMLSWCHILSSFKLLLFIVLICDFFYFIPKQNQVSFKFCIWCHSYVEICFPLY